MLIHSFKSFLACLGVWSVFAKTSRQKTASGTTFDPPADSTTPHLYTCGYNSNFKFFKKGTVSSVNPKMGPKVFKSPLFEPFLVKLWCFSPIVICTIFKSIVTCLWNFLSQIRWSFWQKDSLVTYILFELCLLWYLAYLQILGNSL